MAWIFVWYLDSTLQVVMDDISEIKKSSLKFTLKNYYIFIIAMKKEY